MLFLKIILFKMLNFLYIIISFSFWNLILIGLFFILLFFIKRAFIKQLKSEGRNIHTITFLHPFCNDFGGGEKVLWMMIKGLIGSNTNTPTKIQIVCGIKTPAAEITKTLKQRFDMEFPNCSKSEVLQIELVRIKSAFLLKPKSMLTMLMQIIGQIFFAFEIITTIHTNVYIDTTGLPFTYLILNIFGKARVYAYTHYPFISSDMINAIQDGTPGVHSRSRMAKFKLFKFLKLAYYKLIYQLYRANGRFIQHAFCNSTWTYDHMKQIWSPEMCSRLYPPCSTAMYGSEKLFNDRENKIVSFAQIRPEKDHKVQIDIMRRVVDRFPKNMDLKLVIVGAVRDINDENLLRSLKEYVKTVGLEGKVEFEINKPFEEVKRILETAKIGIHTMKDEHFGISIIEMMSAGLAVIAHCSAGPKLDIIGNAPGLVGMLANSKIGLTFR